MADIEVRSIDIDRLVLDPRNPRIAPLIDSVEGTPPREWVMLALGRHSGDDEERGTSTSYSSLRESIRANGGVMQPIIVAPTPDGNFVVIEGNTRVAIYIELRNDDEPGDWKTIPAIVRSQGDEKGEHAVRLQAHLVGPRPWRPYAKAKYLHDLFHQNRMTMPEIHAICGGSGRQREIKEYINAFEDMQTYYVPLLEAGEAIDQSRFSAFVEGQKQPVLDALARHRHTKADFASWVKEDRFTPLNTVRQLPRILANPMAKQIFLARNAGEALRVIEQPPASATLNDATLEQLAGALAVRIRNLSFPETRAYKENPDGRASVAITDCYEELSSLHKMIFPND